MLTQPDFGGEVGRYRINHLSFHEAPRWELLLRDGRHMLASTGHKLLTAQGWSSIEHLRPGERLVGQRNGTVVAVRRAGPGPVVKIGVEGAHTYVTAGVLSHNMKAI